MLDSSDFAPKKWIGSQAEQIKSLSVRLSALNSGKFSRVMDTSLQSLSNDSIQPFPIHMCYVVYELWS